MANLIAGDRRPDPRGQLASSRAAAIARAEALALRVLADRLDNGEPIPPEAFAVASMALEDKFAEAFRAVRGKVDPGLNLAF